MLFLFVILWLLALKKLESITKSSLKTFVTPGNKLGMCHCSVVVSQYSDCITQVIDSKKHLDCCLITKQFLFFPPFFRVQSAECWLITAQVISYKPRCLASLPGNKLILALVLFLNLPTLKRSWLKADFCSLLFLGFFQKELQWLLQKCSTLSETSVTASSQNGKWQIFTFAESLKFYYWWLGLHCNCS